MLVSGLGSSAGIEAVSNGTAEIATSSRGLNEQEQSLGLTTIPVAHDGIAVIVNEENPVKDLSVDQLRDIYAGKITNWSEVGGEDLAIQLVNRDEASGTREAFKSIVMDGAPFDRRAAVLSGTGQVRDVVSRSRGAIGYISMGFVDSKYATTSVSALSVNGVAPSEDTISTGEYPHLARPVLLHQGRARRRRRRVHRLRPLRRDGSADPRGRLHPGRYRREGRE